MYKASLLLTYLKKKQSAVWLLKIVLYSLSRLSYCDTEKQGLCLLVGNFYIIGSYIFQVSREDTLIKVLSP